MVIFILFTLLFFPFFIWLSLTYVGYNQVGVIVDSMRKTIYIGFLFSLSLFHFISNTIFSLSASYGLPITILIILCFSTYMLVVIVRDKKSPKDIGEMK
ncbi:hypothetical protein [Bacillus sp. B1-b2]|uniref:hypothetical protein n=1 Tax=Bacillus sp. B1-b2 TaxID=2653201 RepID=UPI0012624F29|nr:hypothetical protein [Bacillus sp. B1-b2]KAB7666878.1 hypothetical protein F9279_16580 [Bacillus sp. B1-b2]